MKRIVLWLMSTVTVLVLLFGYHTSTSSRAAAQGANAALAAPLGGAATGSAAAPSGSAASPAAPSSAAPSSAGPAPAAPSPAASPTTGSVAAGTPSSTTVTGAVVQTRFGPIQVQITVQNRKITKVSVPQYPNETFRDQEINAQALPMLVQETMSAQSANIDMISGATYTSDGYLQSLQSALDKAGL